MSLSDGHLGMIERALTPARDARSVVSTERRAIEEWLKRRLNMYSFFESGSWSHGTATITSDVDYFAWLPGPRPTSCKDALGNLHGELAFWYRSDPVEVTVQQPTVRLRFRNKDQPDLEVVPAYLRGTNDYWIPDPAGGTGWVPSSPRSHKEYVNQAQRRDDGTKGLIRLMKGWAILNQASIISLYLEMRTAKRIIDTPPVMRLHDMHWLFRSFVDSELAEMNDPSDFDGRRIAPTLSETARRSALTRVREARDLTARALDLERQERKAEMESVLQSLFRLPATPG